MNKQLLSLFNEAGFHQPEMERLGVEDKFEKFAELIVQECLDICNSVAFSAIVDQKEFTIEDVNNKIKEHFEIKQS